MLGEDSAKKFPNLSVALSPLLIPTVSLKGTIAVVIDVFRATSCMVTGMAEGITEMQVYASVDDCRVKRENGFLLAGERNGKKIAGFELGNSPLEYKKIAQEGKRRGERQKIALTTTNGTQAIEACRKADEIVIGAFLNASAIINYLAGKNRDVVLVCAGWKGKVNMEDTVCAALISNHLTHFRKDDSATLLNQYWNKQESDFPVGYEAWDHALRLGKLGLEKDLAFCLERDIYQVVPKVEGNSVTLIE